MNKQDLILYATKARELSYSPYSNFKVGAALLCKDGKVFYGSNIENASYPLCMCAERNAIYNAMMDGYKKDDFVALALIADSSEPCAPCGACRQVMSELLHLDTPVYMANMKGELISTTVKDLLPYAFSSNDLGK